MKKKLIGLLAATATVALLAGCGGSAAPKSDATAGDAGVTTITAGTLTVGLSPDYPPMEYLDGDKLIGADVDLITEVAKRMGKEVKFEQQKFDQLINSVRTARVDVVISGMSDTLERQQTLEFVDYFLATGRFYTLPELAGEFTKDTDICGKSVALSTKTDYYPALQKLNTELCEGAGLAPIQIVGADSGAAARLQLDQGRAQLAVQGASNLAYFEAQTPGKYKIVLGILNEEMYGISVKKGNTALAEALQSTLKEMYDDGTTAAILTKWGLGDNILEPVINGVKA